MRIGVPREIKNQEARVSLTPAGAYELVQAGHEVVIETNAGARTGYDDAQYAATGCHIVETAQDVFSHAEMVVKVKEPQPEEIQKLRPEHCLFTYLHLAPDLEQARGLMASGATCIAYETVTDRSGDLPLLTPMSEVAGRLSVQAGIQFLQSTHGGCGVLLGGVSGVAPAKVLVLGGGVAGLNAAQMAMGLGADVTVLERSSDRIRQLNSLLGGRARIVYSTHAELDNRLGQTDLLIGAVLLAGATAPKLVTARQIASMPNGAVAVDIAIDQGGCLETSRPTTHDSPVFIQYGVTHYCVTNMPASVARTATQALTNVTLPFLLDIANKGLKGAMAADPGLLAGLNVQDGQIVHPVVAASLKRLERGVDPK